MSGYMTPGLQMFGQAAQQPSQGQMPQQMPQQQPQQQQTGQLPIGQQLPQPQAPGQMSGLVQQLQAIQAQRTALIQQLLSSGVLGQIGAQPPSAPRQPGAVRGGLVGPA